MKRLFKTLPTPRRLSTRLVLLFLGVLLLVQGAAFLAVRESIDRNARAALARDLEVGERIWARLLEQRAQKLLLGASVLAADYGFRSAVLSGDRATLASVLDNHGARLEAAVTAMLDVAMKPLAVSEGTSPGVMPALQALAPRLSANGSALAMVGGVPYQFVMVPLKAPQTVGHVVMGFALDQALVDDLRAVSGLHVALVARDGRGGERVALTTLPPPQAEELTRRQPEGDLITLADDPHVCRAIEQIGDFTAAMGDRATATGGALRTVLLRSVEEAVAPYRQLQALLAAITLGGLAAAGVGSMVTARRVTTPLGVLADASARLGRGDYATPIEHVERRDEVGALARAFDEMRRDIASHEAQILNLAYRDRLTQLPNRASFRDALQRAIEGASPGTAVSVVMLDLDRFKPVNDKLGYAFGDRLLKAVAERLQGQIVRQGDIVARLSGDEFALLLPGADPDRARTAAERIADVFELPVVLDGQPVDLPAGFGVASWPAHGDDADTLLSRAEVAMYVAKQRTTRVLVYDPSIDSGSAETLSLLSDLRRAIDEGQLRLFLQPKVDLAGGQIVGAEALVRWQHPARGMVPPMDFIPFAEQTGFVRQLTLWIFEEAARQFPTLRALGLRRIAVNLSVRDLLDVELPDKLEAILSRQGAPATAFCLEITESMIMEDPGRSAATLQRLAAAGFRLAIDDFGTGQSSLSYVAGLPVQELKIDKSFVMDMDRNPRHAVIVRSTIDLAHNLGLEVVAEGIESAAIWGQLAVLHCDEGQGFHISKPLPAASLPAFVAGWNAVRMPAPARPLH